MRGGVSDNASRVEIPNGVRIASTAAVLFILWVGLPVRLQQSSGEPSNEDCLTLADAPPAPAESALAALERSSVLVPNDVELMADLGAAYEGAGKAREAEAVYTRALAIDPGYADLRFRLLQRGLPRRRVAKLKPRCGFNPIARACATCWQEPRPLGRSAAVNAYVVLVVARFGGCRILLADLELRRHHV